jgi:hypothetical protein
MALTEEENARQYQRGYEEARRAMAPVTATIIANNNAAIALLNEGLEALAQLPDNCEGDALEAWKKAWLERYIAPMETLMRQSEEALLAAKPPAL